jgi:hypothetical protein
MEIIKEWQLRVAINAWESLLYWGHKWSYCSSPRSQMRIQHRWNNNWRGRADVFKEKSTPVTFFHTKFHMDCPGIEPGSPQWKAGE